MQLKNLVGSLNVRRIAGPLECEIESITYDSRHVERNSLFIALRGGEVDGHAFIDQAIDKGAVAILAEEDEERARATCIIVENSRAAMADVAAVFYRNPAARMKIAGVTGTNGKTTVSFLLKHICEKATLRCGLIGTVRYEIGERILPAARTTPESLDLQDLLARMQATECRAVVMEVSSHALMQERVRGIEFDVAVFTNLSQDHLDYHGTMQNYFEAKARLFTGLLDQRKKAARAVINIDDRYGALLVEKLGRQIPVITYGLSARADFRASSFKAEFGGTSYQLDARDKSFLVRIPLIGRFNIYNSLAALASASALGIEPRAAVLSLAKAPQVPGRLQAVPARRQFQVFVDYAHTDDALINVMKTLRELSPNRLIVVFGCGGNRDAAKRPLMGKAADEAADYTIITSDNPRKEEPEAIIADIEKGFRSKNYEMAVDRKEAIIKAISLAQPRDIVLIAGKGHETYQEFADHTVPFDDLHVAQSALEMRPVGF